MLDAVLKIISEEMEAKGKILLVYKDFFKNFVKQYDNIYETGLIKCRPTCLVTIVDNEVETKNQITAKSTI